MLQRVLDRLDVDWEWAMSTSASQPVLNSVVEAIRKTNFVVGVLNDRTPRENVMLELGMAIGLGKPILLLKVGETVVPSELSGFSLLATDLEDERLLSFQVDLFLRSLEGKPSSKRTFPFSAPSSTEVDDLTPLPGLFESAFEQSVAAAINKAGGRVTIPSPTGQERTPDLLMWLPQLDKDLFNPAAIEVVGSKQVDLKAVQQRLASFIRSTGLRSGLIVVNSTSLERKVRQLTPIPYIFVLTLHELKSKLSSSELAVWLKHERNRLAHGAR